MIDWYCGSFLVLKSVQTKIRGLVSIVCTLILIVGSAARVRVTVSTQEWHRSVHESISISTTTSSLRLHFFVLRNSASCEDIPRSEETCT